MNTKLELIVDGAGCQSCVDAIEGALKASDGIETASFDLDSKTAVVMGNRPVEDLISIIDEAGYDATLKAQ